MSDQLFDTGEPAGADGPEEIPANAPLAVRMRPRTLDEVVGQEHIVGAGSALRAAIESGRPHSAILYGPPGAGKTTLARIAARMADGAFEEESAVNAGKAEIRGVIERARERRRSGRGTVLFLDEIHRFNKAQQDALLPAVEEGLLTLIGATTENPYFEVNSALISRSQVYELEPLSAAEVEELLRRALGDPKRGIAEPPPVADEALAMLAERSGGDARTALSGLERATERAAGKEVDVAAIEDALQRRAIDYDRQGDRHYDFISAWIKSTRGSDVDASLYYLAVMLEGGEDPRFLARRMVILASEDIGNADPMALVVADAAARAVDRVGLPECALNLSQAAIYLALAPKSNAATTAIGAAREEVRRHGAQTPPDYLRDAHYPGAQALGRGQGYQYAHDHPGSVAAQQYLPDALAARTFYAPTGNGREKAFGERLAELRKRLGKP
ncbi:MAG TPA: replication-associated recombination protein A [Solirubrobacterales bacterium]|jgi:putative ATPase|nr:replication-associated recombination protein A [Solirubrobacterales bacterium]